MPRARNEPFGDWDEVAEFTLTLPGTELGSSYGRPAVRVGGKAFIYTSREPGSFAVACPFDEKELLMETEPETFWETDHYRGWPAVLIRYGSPSVERIEAVIERAWFDRAPRRLKAARDRP